MKILMLTSTFHPVIGGAESYARTVALGLGALGHDVAVVTDVVDQLPSAEPLRSTVNVHRLTEYRNHFEAPDKIFWEQMQFGLCDEIARLTAVFEPEVVLTNSLDLCSLGKLLSLHHGIPWVATFHEQAPEREALGDARLRFAYDLLEPSAVIAGSRFYLARAHRYGKPHTNHLIYHGIDTERFSDQCSAAAVRKHYGIPHSHALLVSTGRLKPRKGFEDLIKAVHALRERCRSVCLVIAGTVNSASVQHRTELQTLVQVLGLEKQVTFDEGITQERMPWLLSGADVVVQASREEGLGFSVIEAMACQRPVVATRIDGFKEVVTSETVAVLVEPGSSTDIAAAVDSLLRSKEQRDALGRRARAHVVERFSAGRMVAATASLLQNLITDYACIAR